MVLADSSAARPEFGKGFAMGLRCIFLDIQIVLCICMQYILCIFMFIHALIYALHI